MAHIKIQKLLISCCYLILPFSFAEAQKITLSDAILIAQQHDPAFARHHAKTAQITNNDLQQRSSWLPKLTQVKSNYDPSNNDNHMQSSATWDMPLGLQINTRVESDITFDNPSMRIDAKLPLLNVFSPNYKDQALAVTEQIHSIEAQQKYETLVFDVIKSYRSTVVAKYEFNAQQHAHDIIKLELAKQTQAYQSGKVSKLELDELINKSETEMLKTHKSQHTYHKELKKLKNKLHISDATEIEIDYEIRFSKPSLEAVETLIQSAPDARVALLQESVARHEYDLARQANKPQLNLTGTLDESGEYKIGLNFEINPNQHVHPHSIRSAHHTFLEKIDTHQQSYDSTYEKIADSIFEIELLTEEIEISAHSLNLAQKTFNAASIKHKYNQLSTAEFMEATQKLRDAYQKSLKLQMQYANQIDELNLITGKFDETISSIL